MTVGRCPTPRGLSLSFPGRRCKEAMPISIASPETYKSNSPIYDYGYANLAFFILGDTKNLTMYNCFNFGAYSGIKFVSEGNGGPTGISLGLGLDADEKAFYIEKGVVTKDFPSSTRSSSPSGRARSITYTRSRRAPLT